MKTYIITEEQVKAQFDEIQKLLERALEAERFISDIAMGWNCFSPRNKKANDFILKLIDIDKIVDFEKLHPKFEEHEKSGIDLSVLEKKLQDAIAKETPESLTEWLLQNQAKTMFDDDAKTVLLGILSKLDEMIEQAQKSEMIFEQHKMVNLQITSGAMAIAYKNAKQCILDEF